MFLGEAEHSLDDKGRVVLPAKYRDELVDGAVIAKGRGDCLFIYSTEEFERVAQDLREKSKEGPKGLAMARSFFSGAEAINPDKQGRVAIPPKLRQYAGLQRDVVVAGVFSRIEIWDRQRWADRGPAGDESLTDETEFPEVGL
jgi:MraZ protein